MIYVFKLQVLSWYMMQPTGNQKKTCAAGYQKY